MKTRDIFILLVVCLLVFWARLGRLGLIDPDEPFYALTAQEMLESGDWVTPQIFGEPQFEKPIFFYWLTAISFKAFGITEWAARLSSAVPATLLVFLVYAFTTRMFNRRTGLLSALVLATGLEYAIMSRLMLTDIALALFIAASLFCYWLALEEEAHRTRWLLRHFVFAALGVLTKGPLATLITVLATVTYSVVAKRGHPYRGAALWKGIALYLLVAAPWYVRMFSKFGWAYFDAFVVHENIMRLLHAEHEASDHYWYYLGILAGGSIPWMPVVVAVCYRGLQGIRHDSRLVFLWSWLLTSFIFLTIARSKLPSYIFFAFVPIAQLAGVALDEILTKGFRNSRERITVLALCGLQFLIAVLPVIATALVAAFPDLGKSGVLALSAVKQAKPFAVPSALFAVCLGAGAIFLWRGKMIAWLAANAVATAALVIGALTFSAEHVEASSSSRPVAKAMMAQRRKNEPLLAGTFLVRGVHFYTHLPVSVIAMKENPFNWTQHALPVVVAEDGLRKFLNMNPTALCAMRRGDWMPYWGTLSLTDEETPPAWWGDNVVVRFGKPRP